MLLVYKTTLTESAFVVLVSIVVSIPACHAGDRGSIPRRGVILLSKKYRPIFKYSSRMYFVTGLLAPSN